MRYDLFFFSSKRRHTSLVSDWSSDVCSSDLRESTLAMQPAALGKSSRSVKERSTPAQTRSEERRVGKECRSRRSPDHQKKNETGHDDASSSTEGHRPQ